MKKTINRLILLAMTLAFCNYGCDPFLDVKPNKKLVIPQSLDDLQALLDYYPNIQFDPAIGEVSADDYYLTTEIWNGLFSENDRQLYIWADHGIYSTAPLDWIYPYRNIYQANVVIENLSALTSDLDDLERWNSIMGQALFLRARAFLSVALIWSKPYNANTADTDLGIPIRLSSDFNLISNRSTLRESYNQILKDLQAAVEYLPSTAIHPYRASKPAALALLARTYLYMGDYANCLLHAEACLALRDDLLDYNTLEKSATYPIPEFNQEILYQSTQSSPPIAPSRAKIDSTLYNSYNDNDLRKTLFFRENSDSSHSFKGSYNSGNTLFSGLATDEVYLMRAECLARLGEYEKALANLNALLEKRMVTETFQPIGIPDGSLLDLILEHRRKELLMRGLRWPDIKRFNQEGLNIGLTRVIDQNTYELLPNSPRFILPIPDIVLTLSDVQQN
ncbi:RagB/SusD family nutrient uptake outer membrane protein [Parapedobacter koreensis]|uniref:SusD family protein n=1 Tax=Parapedobacter koreensis TaxID=332977 RepID=A0A1H7Q1Z6_9SPHI|nr:RagB/SusD family nutrient uptake outer membrane protein [Parapedobacter koreensis]SEL41505.1 SusD family protein [Parapedobacter koreensis]